MSNTTPLNEKAEPVVLPVDLRDYFAAKAMQGMWANVEVLKQLPSDLESKTLALMAYEMSDALLKAREQ